MNILSNWQGSSINTRLHLFGAAIVSPLVLSLSFFVYKDIVGRPGEAQRDLAVLAGTTRAQSEQFLQNTETFLSGLAVREDIRAAGHGRCAPIFATFTERKSEYANLIQWDAADSVTCSALAKPATGPDIRPERPQLLDQVRKGRHLVVGPPELDPISGRWVVPVVHLVEDAYGRYAGLIGVSIDVNQFRPIVEHLAASDRADVVVVDGDGVVFARTRNASLRVGERHDRGFIRTLADVREAVAQTRERIGPERLFHLEPIARTGWFVLAATDYAPIRAAMWRDVVGYGLLLGLVALVWIWLANWINRVISNPILALAATAVAVASGNRQVRAAAGGAKEVSVLGEQFNHMLDALRQSETRFRALMALSADWYWEQDKEFRFIEMSEPTLAALRFPGDREVMGMRRWELRNFGLSGKQWEAHRAQLELHEPFRALEYGRIASDGSRYYFSVSGEPVFDDQGQFKGYCGVSRDITSRKQAEDALRQSEARLSGIVENALVGIVTLDEQQRIVLFNPAAEAMFGFRTEEVINRHIDLLIPERVRVEYLERFEVLLKGGDSARTVPTRGRLAGWCLDGSELVMEASISRHQTEEGALLTLILSDVTPQLAAERRLRQFSAAVEQSPVGIVITNLRGEIEYVNPRFTQSTGYSLEEVLGRNPRFLKSGETPASEYKRLWNTISDGGEWSGELHNKKKNGDLFWEFTRVIPIVSSDGAILNYMAVKEDITQRKGLEARERLHREQMIHNGSLISMGKMAAVLAHEINQPLMAIANSAGIAERKLALDSVDWRGIRETIGLIKGDALRAGEILSRVRDFVRKRDAPRVATDINAVVQDIVRLADIAARAAGVSINVDLIEELPEVTADRIQIEQALFNIIRNGIEAMEQVAGERRLAISTRLDDARRELQVAVCDSGCGLPEHVAANLFNPFFTTKPEGMGMGLSISWDIVEAHGGRIWATRNEGAGTTFCLSLPLILLCQ